MADLELGQAHADRLRDISQDVLRARSKAAHLAADAAPVVKDALTRSITRLEGIRASILADADYLAHVADVAATQTQVEALTAQVADLQTQLAATQTVSHAVESAL